jgi:hypothetical protein
MDPMTDLITPEGGIRTDHEALSIVTSALKSEPAVNDVVIDIRPRHVAKGAFGLLVPARLRTDGTDVLIKINATDYEIRWLEAIGAIDPEAAPAVFGSGQSFGDVGLGWMVMERLPHQPPGFGGPEWYGPLLAGAFRWQDAARQVTLNPLHEIDGEWLRGSIEQAVELDGTSELRRLRDRFDDDWGRTCELCGPPEPAHGDVHFFNAGSRTAGVPQALVLFDPIPRLARWPFDAANCQTLTNYRSVDRERPPLVVAAARHRRDLGLATPDDRHIEVVSDFYCAWLSVMWRVHFRAFAPERAAFAAEYVARAVAHSWR